MGGVRAWPSANRSADAPVDPWAEAAWLLPDAAAARAGLARSPAPRAHCSVCRTGFRVRARFVSRAGDVTGTEGRGGPVHSGRRRNVAQNVPVASARVISKEPGRDNCLELDTLGRCVLTCFSDSFPRGFPTRVGLPEAPVLWLPVTWTQIGRQGSALSPHVQRGLWRGGCWASNCGHPGGSPCSVGFAAERGLCVLPPRPPQAALALVGPRARAPVLTRDARKARLRATPSRGSSVVCAQGPLQTWILMGKLLMGALAVGVT